MSTEKEKNQLSSIFQDYSIEFPRPTNQVCGMAFFAVLINYPRI